MRGPLGVREGEWEWDTLSSSEMVYVWLWLPVLVSVCECGKVSDRERLLVEDSVSVDEREGVCVRTIVSVMESVGEALCVSVRSFDSVLVRVPIWVALPLPVTVLLLDGVRESVPGIVNVRVLVGVVVAVALEVALDVREDVRLKESAAVRVAERLNVEVWLPAWDTVVLLVLVDVTVGSDDRVKETLPESEEVLLELFVATDETVKLLEGPKDEVGVAVKLCDSEAVVVAVAVREGVLVCVNASDTVGVCVPEMENVLASVLLGDMDGVDVRVGFKVPVTVDDRIKLGVAVCVLLRESEAVRVAEYWGDNVEV